MEELNKIKFQVETKRVLEILSNEIYDSPYALLRENIQNAYDAVLMRIQAQPEGFQPLIDVIITNEKIIIRDNGIGMTEEVLRKNFWTAGSSGKRNELAQSAGVVGTFGIGAMANFGVCSELIVETKAINQNLVLLSKAVRENLSISENCISLESRTDELFQEGTQITAIMDPSKSLNQTQAINYLRPYIQYLKVPVKINEVVQNTSTYDTLFFVDQNNFEQQIQNDVVSGRYSFNCNLIVQKNATVKVKISNILLDKVAITGDIVLEQGRGQLMGLRNSFGLAPIPINQVFNLGGFANLSNLTPTAGREAISRESIEFVGNIISLTEKFIAEQLAILPLADRNQSLLNYIVNHNRYDLAKNIQVNVKPMDEMVNLAAVKEFSGQKQLHFYPGNDQSMIQTFANENSNLLVLSQSNPRRQIQNHYIVNTLKIQQVADEVQVRKTYTKNEINLSEFAILLKVISTIQDDYLITNVDVFFADITHSVPYLVKFSNDKLTIHISREAGAVVQLLATYDTAYEVFTGFVKDFVRIHLYPKFSQNVPSATRMGAEALHKILMKNRELFKYESTELGEIDSLMKDYLSGKIEFSEVLKVSKSIARVYSQTVAANQVGSVEQEIPNLISNQEIVQVNQAENLQNSEETPMPGILRLDTESPMKLLRTAKAHPSLNNFRTFLSLSDKLYRCDKDFFLEPHTTKVIYGSHKVVYIFTHASSRMTLYYDIELKEKLSSVSAGGMLQPTTTIITKNRIYVPLPEVIESSFFIEEGASKEFYIRYDIITDYTIK